MKLKRILILAGIVVAAGAGGLMGFNYWDAKQQAAERERAAEEARVAMERHRAEEKLRVIDSIRMVDDYSVPRQESDPRRTQLLAKIAQTKSQFIVFPPSAPMHRANLDLTARITIARQIAQLIEAETGVPVARAAMKSFKVKEPALREIKEGDPAGTYLPHPAFIEGYAAVKEHDYAKVAAALQPMYESRSPGQPSFAQSTGHWAFAPYLALALAKTGKGDDAIALDQRLRTPTAGDVTQPPRTVAMPEFHHHLILAIGYAFGGNHAQAQSEVQQARAALNNDHLVDTGYVFVEILERLSEETRQPAYLNAALDYARVHQRLEPWTSWAYAFEARHAPAGAARIRAAGIALKLDPQSQWLHELDKQTLQQAQQWASGNRWPGKDSPSTPAKWNQA